MPNMLRSFTSNDYDTFAGADDFCDGQPPMIGEAELEATDDNVTIDFTIVVSGDGVGATGATVGCYNEDNWFAKAFANKDTALAVATVLLNTITVERFNLLVEGFGFDSQN